MQESNIINQNARKVAVKVLVKDDVPLFLQHKSPIYQKGTYYPDPKSEMFIYDQLHKNLPKYGKTFQQSMLSLCQQYNTSMQMFPYFTYYNPGALAASLATTVTSEEDTMTTNEQHEQK